MLIVTMIMLVLVAVALLLIAFQVGYLAGCSRVAKDTATILDNLSDAFEQATCDLAAARRKREEKQNEESVN